MNVLADAKEEYTRQLTSVLIPEIYVGIKSIYEAAYTHCNKTGDKNVFKKFQLLLSNIPNWNKSKKQNEYARIVEKTECDWIDDLITAVFVSHAKVLSSIQIKNTNKSIPLNVPVGSFFLHKCYEQCARNFWRKSWLLDIDTSSIDIQRNMIDSENLIKESILETIRKLLPVKYILKEYIGNDYQDEDTVDNIDKSISASAKKNLRTLVRKELEQTLATTSADDNYSSLEIPNHSEVMDVPRHDISAHEEMSSNKRTVNKATHKAAPSLEESTVQDKVYLSLEESEESAVEDKVAPPLEEPEALAVGDKIAPPLEEPEESAVGDKIAPPLEEPEESAVEDKIAPPLEEPEASAVEDKIAPPLEEPEELAPQDKVSPPLEKPVRLVVQDKVSPPLEESHEIQTDIKPDKEAKLDSMPERTYSDITDYNSIDSAAEDIKKKASEVELQELTIGTNSDALHEMRRDIKQNSITFSDTKEGDEFSFFDGAADFY